MKAIPKELLYFVPDFFICPVAYRWLQFFHVDEEHQVYVYFIVDIELCSAASAKKGNCL
jgi:hypothetical protein